MTNKDRLISLIGFQPSSNSLEGALIDAGMDGAETYTATNSKTIKRCAIRVMELLITTPNQTNDVGLVISYDRAAVLRLINQYKVDIGEAKAGPTLRFISL